MLLQAFFRLQQYRNCEAFFFPFRIRWCYWQMTTIEVEWNIVVVTSQLQWRDAIGRFSPHTGVEGGMRWDTPTQMLGVFHPMYVLRHLEGLMKTFFKPLMMC
jgi:hypothetical protein